jgi:hypothetical protein
MEKIVDGDFVIYHDTHGKPHNALVTAAWGGTVDGAINLVYVSDEETERDAYGQQTKRESSVTHGSKTNVFGRYWRRSTEEARPMAVSS